MSNRGSRHIVCDAGPLISLEKMTGGYRFIRRLYERLIIPPAVMHEVVAGQFETQDAYIRHYMIGDLISIQSPKPVSGSRIAETVAHLDLGEREAIRLSLQLELPLLIEEREGRSVADALGVRISGIAGQLLKAVREEVSSREDAAARLMELRHAGRINRQVFEAVSKAIHRET